MNLREKMPLTAAFIDEMREAFGAESIDASIKAAVRDGKATFYAFENGIAVGVHDARNGLPLTDMVIEAPASTVQAGEAISATPTSSSDPKALD